MDSNSLYYGDNLDILRRYVEDESADLIYLDPPFNSNQTYNILFQEKDGTQSASQIKAFGDTWHWDETAARSYEETVEAGGQVAEALQAFRKLLGANDILAYMSMMAPRLVELRRVMKPTGSLYLHCDPTASHFLKLLLDPQPQREEGKRPRPQHKRLWASLEKRPEEVIEQALGEARSRDPTGRKSWVVLVDGDLGAYQLQE